MKSKNGNVDLDEQDQRKKILSVKAVFDKNNCFDIFKNTQVKG